MTVTDMALADRPDPLRGQAPWRTALVDAGMVVRQRDPQDGRRSVLALTDAGERRSVRWARYGWPSGAV